MLSIAAAGVGGGLPRGWLHYPRRHPSAALRLLCFPYAGGSGRIFADWPGGIPRQVEVGWIELPGHGLRLLERPMSGIGELAGRIVEQLHSQLDRPVALFGHSMGGLIAFEVARSMRRNGLPAPARLYVSAHQAPQLPFTAPAIHELADPQFLDAIAGYGATPPGILANAEMMRMLGPALRADFAACGDVFLLR